MPRRCDRIDLQSRARRKLEPCFLFKAAPYFLTATRSPSPVGSIAEANRSSSRMALPIWRRTTVVVSRAAGLARWQKASLRTHTGGVVRCACTCELLPRVRFSDDEHKQRSSGRVVVYAWFYKMPTVVVPRCRAENHRA